MGARRRWDPCLDAVRRRGARPAASASGSSRSSRPGTNGGAQEHVFDLLSRLDASRYEASVVALSAGSAVRKLSGPGSRSPSSTSRTTPSRSAP